MAWCMSDCPECSIFFFKLCGIIEGFSEGLGTAIWAPPFGCRRLGAAVWAPPFGRRRLGAAVWARPFGRRGLSATIWVPPFGRRRLGAAEWAPDNWAPCRLGTGHLGAVSQFLFYFSSYEEKTMKQAIP